MVSVTWAFVAFMGGLAMPLVIPLLGQVVALDLRQKISQQCFSWAEAVLGPTAIMWRKLGRPTLKSIEIDDEREVAEVTQSSGTLSDDQKHPFRDPADAKQTLFSKVVTVVPEGIPAAVDAEMAEIGYWYDRHAQRGDLQKDGQIDPMVRMDTRSRAVDPHDVVAHLDESVTSEDIKTTERHTRARFEKYGGGPSAKEAGVMLVSFGVGAGVVMGAVYVRQQILGGGGTAGGGGITEELPPGMIDVALTVLSGVGL